MIFSTLSSWRKPIAVRESLRKAHQAFEASQGIRTRLPIDLFPEMVVSTLCSSLWRKPESSSLNLSPCNQEWILASARMTSIGESLRIGQNQFPRTAMGFRQDDGNWKLFSDIRLPQVLCRFVSSSSLEIPLEHGNNPPYIAFQQAGSVFHSGLSFTIWACSRKVADFSDKNTPDSIEVADDSRLGFCKSEPIVGDAS